MSRSVVELPSGAQTFDGEQAAELVGLSDTGRSHVLLLILQKAADESVNAYEIDETTAANEFQALESTLAERRHRRPCSPHGPHRGDNRRGRARCRPTS